MYDSHLTITRLVSQGLLTAVVGVVGAAVLATMPEPAFSGQAMSPGAQYSRDLAHCRSLTPKSTERANCLSEASTRFHATQPRKPSETQEQLAANAVQRCNLLPASDQEECQARIQYGTANGSVAGGGVLRTLVTREPMQDPAALPATAAGVPSQAASGAVAAPAAMTPAAPAAPAIVPAPAAPATSPTPAVTPVAPVAPAPAPAEPAPVSPPPMQ